MQKMTRKTRNFAGAAPNVSGGHCLMAFISQTMRKKLHGVIYFAGDDEQR